MKKALSIVLTILIIVLAVPTTVFAAPPKSPIIGFPTGANMLNMDEVEDFGDIILGTADDTLNIPIIYSNFTTENGGAPTLSDVDDLILDSVTLRYTPSSPNLPSFEELFNVIPQKSHEHPSENPTFKLVPKNIGSVDGKLVLIWKNDFEQIVSKEYNIKGNIVDPTINKKIVAISGENMGTDSRYVAYNNQIIWTPEANKPEELNAFLTNLNIQPGDEIAFSLHTQHFIWDPLIEIKSSVRKSTLDNNYVNAIKTVVAGNDIIESVHFENKAGGSAAFVIKFKETYPITKERDFEMNLALGIRGQRNVDSSVDLLGAFGNPIYYADMDDDYVFIGDGMVVEAERSVRNMELDLDNGVSVFANLSENKRYYGRSSALPSKDDRDIMNFFPSIRKVLTLTTTNIKNSAKHVILKEELNYYVYDGNGQYLGRAHDELPFSDKYFLSLEYLEVEVDFGDITDQAPREAGYPEDPSDLYYNPPTGGVKDIKQDHINGK